MVAERLGKYEYSDIWIFFSANRWTRVISCDKFLKVSGKVARWLHHGVPCGRCEKRCDVTQKETNPLLKNPRVVLGACAVVVGMGLLTLGWHEVKTWL